MFKHLGQDGLLWAQKDKSHCGREEYSNQQCWKTKHLTSKHHDTDERCDHDHRRDRGKPPNWVMKDERLQKSCQQSTQNQSFDPKDRQNIDCYIQTHRRICQKSCSCHREEGAITKPKEPFRRQEQNKS
jgi:hypothetical protein